MPIITSRLLVGQVDTSVLVELQRVRKTILFPGRSIFKDANAVKGCLNDILALVSCAEVACGFRYDPNHCVEHISCCFFRHPTHPASTPRELRDQHPLLPTPSVTSGIPQGPKHLWWKRHLQSNFAVNTFAAPVNSHTFQSLPSG